MIVRSQVRQLVGPLHLYLSGWMFAGSEYSASRGSDMDAVYGPLMPRRWIRQMLPIMPMSGRVCRVRNTVVVARQVTRTRKWISILVLPAMWANLVFLSGGSIPNRLSRWLLVYLASVLVLVLLTILREGSVRALIGSRRTSEVPNAVADALPKLMWVARNREPERAARLFFDGALLARDNVSYTALLATWLTAAMVARAIGDDDDEGVRAQLVEEAMAVASVLPTAPDSDRIQRWLAQIRGGEVSYQFRRGSEFTAADLSALIALGAAAASVAHLGRQAIYDQYTTISESFTHGSRIPPAWV